MTNTIDSINSDNDENKLVIERRIKLNKYRELGFEYPNDVSPTKKTIDIINKYTDLDADAINLENVIVKISGRMMLKRIMGKASFSTIKDSTNRIQIYISQKNIGEEAYNNFKQFDLGDILIIEGKVFKTNKGELSINVKSISLVSKAIRPLPEKFHGISDHNIKYRQRYIDLIVSEETKKTFELRSKIIANIRQYMSKEGFMEVETPMLHKIPGGAAAKPFTTHHNSLNMDMYLRIAPELYLKRLIVGGFDRVFELNRNFRNEGTSPRHNPEFTMMEFYATYTDYKWMMDFTELLIREISISINNKNYIDYQGNTINLSKPFERLSICEAICKYNNKYDLEQLNDYKFLQKELHRIDNKISKDFLMLSKLGELQLCFFEKTTEEKVWDPTYIIDYPVETSPLARQSDANKKITERFELFISGKEIANGFSELNDPEEQAKRLLEQADSKNENIDDSHEMFFDSDYITALEYGMPPTGGCGIGIDRLVMLLTNKSNIKDVILFPHLRER
ncbi:class II lysyl-tRNA synthetase [Candidatus Kinetoplastibacterium blastocrithidii TCC012E]|uniref:Lysine--tRNA ligase n=2 Tax=cellular organisms TaxID=131567 RepID=S9VML7_9TRYP|nr:lysine--tRNA ligase [Candidatus Kinetoplastibacterium blastocrithidii]AFZ83570.1 lysyl-tRNA synthetase [Candidatus Kinetoplastibacterium blastocrithidii (ex Strigomonas culicis)]AGF49689.1 class II lysyl-tRNA synthetase [Candidatus Kinetoplastibacterium blastocrithidii TCC012E]EPY28396.1 lysyl-tRNA synthetase, class II [Strigomonas culicis]|eukprot:EPY28396.1 lysyl-tRNA synthetase, class II [Strigomonas culicis]